MTKPTIEDLERLIREIIFPFYQLERDAPLKFAAGRKENDAEHSWSLALFSCALAPLVDAKLDVGKVSQFAVVHDVVEIYAGDVSNFAPEAEKAGKATREHEALEKIDRESAAFPWIAQTITEYEKQSSPEAQFVKSVDKVLLLLMDYVEEGFFYQQRKITQEQWQTKMQKHREKASVHAGTFEYYDQIWSLLLSHPEFFYPDK